MVSNAPEVKQLNTERIRREVQNKSRCTKAEISRLTDLSVATCSTIINSMLESQEILQVEQETPNVGRPASVFRYNPDYQHALGMYVETLQGVNTISCIVADGLARTIYEDVIHPEEITYEIIEQMAQRIIERDGHIQGMTFGIPGISHHGVIERCDVKSIIGVDIEGNLGSKFGFDVDVRNDMDFVTSGVYASLAPNKTSLAAIYFPQNADDGCVGCGIVVRGKVLRGASKFAGELSYILQGFGISREEQIRIIVDNDRAAFRKMAAKAVLILIGTIDPGTIMLMGNDVCEEDVAVICEECQLAVSEQHIPKIMVDNDIAKNYNMGLVRAALDSMQFPITM